VTGSNPSTGASPCGTHPLGARNGAALVGILLDQAEANGQVRPSAGDRRALMAGGLRERFRGLELRGPLPSIALGAGLGFWMYYLTVAWAGAAGFEGSFGPFANGFVVAGVPWALAATSALLGRPAAARALVALSVAMSVGCGVLASVFALGWMGPGPGTVIGIASVGLVALCGRPSGHRIAVSVSALAVLALGVATPPVMTFLFNGHF
jgi:hypothetical protein